MSGTADTGQGGHYKDSLAGGDAMADGKNQSHDQITESTKTELTESTEQQSIEMREEKKHDEEEKRDKEDEKEEEYVDVLGNGTLLKKVLQKGSGDRPMMGDKVTITWSKEIPELELSFPEEELTFILGDGDEVQAIDLCVALMYVNEVASIVAGYKYMYGELGLEPDIPARANFKLTVHLKHTYGPLDYSSLTFHERFAEAKKKKERGNFLFKRKEFALALNSYTKASKIVDPNLGCVFNDESAKNLQELLEFRAIVLCNTSVCQFRLEAYDAAVKSASEACKLWPSYSKAYCRLGQAQEKLGHIAETIQSYKLALKNDAENSKWLHGELERLTKLNKRNKKSEQEMYSKMFWGSKPPSLNNSPTKAKDPSLFSWLWKMGATVCGAGLVGLAGIGLYKYMNH